MNNGWYTWLSFPDGTYLLTSHPKFEEYNKKYLNMDKETKDWHYTGAIYPPEHYGLKPKFATCIAIVS